MHSHPDMAVISKLLVGKIESKSYTPLKRVALEECKESEEEGRCGDEGRVQNGHAKVSVPFM